MPRIAVLSSLLLLTSLPLLAQSLTRHTNVVTIDREMLERWQITSVSEALRLAAGFDTVRTYFKQDVATARGILQEHYANDVLLMIDGIPTWLASTGEGNLDRIDVGEIERIEVIRGPASVRFGTNAYAGAINIVLRRPDAEEVEGRITAGTDERFGAVARAAFDLAGWSMTLAARADDEDGDRVLYTDESGETGLVREYQDARNFTLTARRARHQLLLNAVSSDESFLGSAPDFAQGMGQDQRSTGRLASYRFTSPFRSRGEWSYRATWDWNARNFSRSRDGITRSNVEGSRLQHDLSLGWRLSPSLRIDAGASYDERRSIEYTNESIRTGTVLSENNMRDREVSERSLFAEGEWRKGAWSALLGSRLTKNGLFGSNVSSHGSLELALGPDSAVHALVRESYRAPSLFELYFETSSRTVFGNTALDPETSLAYEVGYRGTVGPVTGSLDLYRAEYRDKILRIRRNPGDPADLSLIYANGADFEATGAELDLRVALAGGAHGLLAWTWTDAGADSIARFFPENLITAGASIAPMPRLEITALVTHRSAVDGPHERIGAQSTIDLGGSWRQPLGPFTVRHQLLAQNLADDRIAYPEYVRMNLNEIEHSQGRSVRYTARFTWNR